MQQKQKKYAYLAIFLVATIVAASAINFSDGWEWIYPYDPNATPTPTFSTPYPTATPIGQTPTPTPIGQTPTPPPTTQPTVNPTPIKPTVNIWPTFYVTNFDGSTYWVQPNIQIGTEVIVAKNGATAAVISQFQNTIYMQADFHGRTVASIRVDCHEVIKVTTTAGSLISQLASTDISTRINSPVEGSAIQVTGSTITSSQFQSLLQSIGVNRSTYYHFVAELSNVKLIITFSDGTTGLLQSSQTSTLKWEVSII